MNQTLNEKETKPMEETVQYITALEKEADEIAFKLTEEITSGSVNPNILDMLLESVHYADDIVDSYHNISREFGRMSKTSGEAYIDGERKALFSKLMSLSDSALSKMVNLLAASNMTDILQIKREIETLEEQGDYLKEAGFDNLYASAHELQFLQFSHYSAVLRMFDDVLDECEDLANLIVSIVTSISK